MVRAAQHLKNISEIDLSAYITTHLNIIYSEHARNQMKDRKISKTEVNDLIRHFIIAFSKMVKEDLISYFSYKFLVLNKKYRVALRFHFYFENNNIIFILKLITIMNNYEKEIHVDHNVIDVTNGIFLHGKKAYQYVTA